ncbi:MAG: hypothetical protein U0136_19735 [Bdellovibrionota bacterium]
MQLRVVLEKLRDLCGDYLYVLEQIDDRAEEAAVNVEIREVRASRTTLNGLIERVAAQPSYVLTNDDLLIIDALIESINLCNPEEAELDVTEPTPRTDEGKAPAPGVVMRKAARLLLFHYLTILIDLAHEHECDGDAASTVCDLVLAISVGGSPGEKFLEAGVRAACMLISELSEQLEIAALLPDGHPTSVDRPHEEEPLWVSDVTEWSPNQEKDDDEASPDQTPDLWANSAPGAEENPSSGATGEPLDQLRRDILSALEVFRLYPAP